MSRPVRERREYHDRSGGNYASGPNGKINGKMHVARIKPYIISRHLDLTSGNAQHFPMDKYRVFGKAISNAQPFEMVDIMLSRQSI